MVALVGLALPCTTAWTTTEDMAACNNERQSRYVCLLFCGDGLISLDSCGGGLQGCIDLRT
jgi:hypothetical protein